MKLHVNNQLFKEAITYTAQQLNLPEIYIEKDYWVTLALNRIFSGDVGEQVVFKGGTALAKCFNLIERFSEDIDLVVLSKDSESANQLKTILKKISSAIIEELPEIEMPGITNKKGMIRKTAHSFTNKFKGDFGQVRDTIIVEATWLGSFEPYTKRMISSFVYEMMMNTGQTSLIKEYDLVPFEVNVLEPKRTLCEKIMSLVRFSHTDYPINDLINKIRHTYDIHVMLKDDKIKSFFESQEFDILLNKIGFEDLVSFKNNNNWLNLHPSEALIFKEPDTTWDSLKGTYNGDFKGLVFGNFPNEDLILASLRVVGDRLRRIDWNVKTE